MEPLKIIGISLGVITLLLFLSVVTKRDKEMLREVLTLWAGIVGLSVLAFFYTYLKL
jgi:hypothetical protein